MKTFLQFGDDGELSAVVMHLSPGMKAPNLTGSNKAVQIEADGVEVIENPVRYDAGNKRLVHQKYADVQGERVLIDDDAKAPVVVSVDKISTKEE